MKRLAELKKNDVFVVGGVFYTVFTYLLLGDKVIASDEKGRVRLFKDAFMTEVLVVK